MRKTVLIIALIFLLSPALFGQEDEAVQKAGQAAVKRGLDGGAPDWPLFDPSAKMIDQYAPIISLLRSRTLRPEILRGVQWDLRWAQIGTKNGVPFRLSFRDTETSGLVAGAPELDPEKMFVGNSWRVVCSVDAMTDRLSCTVDRMVKLDPHLRLVQYKRDEWVVCIGQNRYPGTAVQIRIDLEPFHESIAENGCFDPQLSMEIVTQMKSASLIRARYMKWPYKNWILLEMTSCGLKEILEMAEWFVALGQ